MYRSYYLGTLGGNAARNFYREIGFCDPQKQSRLEEICECQNNTEVFYCKIKSVEEVDYEGWVYDFEVAEHHNFIANNILCHNTVQVLALLEERRRLREESGRQDEGATGRQDEEKKARKKA